MADRRLPGLSRMVAATPPGRCPFCLDPLPPHKTKPWKHCGDPVCKTAYNRTYRRDNRQGEKRKIRRRIAVSAYTKNNKLWAQKLECGHWWYVPKSGYNKHAWSRYCAECERQHGKQEAGDREGDEG